MASTTIGDTEIPSIELDNIKIQIDAFRTRLETYKQSWLVDKNCKLPPWLVDKNSKPEEETCRGATSPDARDGDQDQKSGQSSSSPSNRQHSVILANQDSIQPTNKKSSQGMQTRGFKRAHETSKDGISSSNKLGLEFSPSMSSATRNDGMIISSPIQSPVHDSVTTHHHKDKFSSILEHSQSPRIDIPEVHSEEDLQQPLIEIPKEKVIESISLTKPKTPIRHCVFSANGKYMIAFSGRTRYTLYGRPKNRKQAKSLSHAKGIKLGNMSMDSVYLFETDMKDPWRNLISRHNEILMTPIWYELLKFIEKYTQISAPGMRDITPCNNHLWGKKCDKRGTLASTPFMPSLAPMYNLAMDNTGDWAALYFEDDALNGSLSWTKNMDSKSHPNEAEYSELMRIRFINASKNKWHEPNGGLLKNSSKCYWGSVSFYPPDSKDTTGKSVKCAILDLYNSSFHFGEMKIGPPEWIVRIVHVNTLETVAAWTFKRFSNSPANLVLMTVPYGFTLESEPLEGSTTDRHNNRDSQYTLLPPKKTSGMSLRDKDGILSWRSERIGTIAVSAINMKQTVMISLESVNVSMELAGFSQYAVRVRDLQTGFCFIRDDIHTFYDMQIEDLKFWDDDGKEFCLLTWESQFDRVLTLRVFDTYTGCELYHMEFEDFEFYKPRIIPSARCIIAIDLDKKQLHRHPIPLHVPLISLDTEKCTSPDGIMIKSRQESKGPQFDITGPIDHLVDPYLATQPSVGGKLFTLNGRKIFSRKGSFFGIWLNGQRLVVTDGSRATIYRCGIISKTEREKSNIYSSMPDLSPIVMDTAIAAIDFPDSPVFSDIDFWTGSSKSCAWIWMNRWSDFAAMNEMIIEEIYQHGRTCERSRYYLPNASLKRFWTQVCVAEKRDFNTDVLQTEYGVDAAPLHIIEEVQLQMLDLIFDNTIKRVPSLFNTIEKVYFPLSRLITMGKTDYVKQILDGKTYVPFYNKYPPKGHKGSDIEVAVDQRTVFIVERLVEYAIDQVKRFDPLFLSGLVPALTELSANYPSQTIHLLEEISYFQLQKGAFAFHTGSLESRSKPGYKRYDIETNLDVGYLQPSFGNKLKFFTFHHDTQIFHDHRFEDCIEKKKDTMKQEYDSIYSHVPSDGVDTSDLTSLSIIDKIKNFFGNFQQRRWENTSDDTASNATTKHTATICALPLPGISEYVTISNSVFHPRSMFSILILDDILPDNPIFFDPIALRVLVSFKWKRFGRNAFIFIALMFVLHYASFSIAIAFTSNADQAQFTANYRSDTQYLTWHLVLLSISFGLCSLFLIQEFRQMVSKMQVYLRSPYNYVDLAAFTLPWVTTLMIFLGKTPRSELVSFATLSIWAHLLLQLRFFRSTGIFIAILIEIFKEIWSYLLVLFIAIVAFAHVLFLLLRGQSPNVGFGENTFNRFDQSLKAVTAFLTGQYEPIKVFTRNRMLDVYMILFTIITAIILLNVLIALLNRIYDDVSRRGTNAFVRQKAALLAEIEVYWLWPSLRRDRNWFPNLIFYEAAADDVFEWRNRLQMAKKRKEQFTPKILNDNVDPRPSLKRRQQDNFNNESKDEILEQLRILTERVESLIASQPHIPSSSSSRGRSMSSRPLFADAL